MRIFKLSIVLCLVLAAACCVCGCIQSDEPETSASTAYVFDGTINWNLRGVWVDVDGKVLPKQESVDFSISGTLPMEFEPYSTVQMELNIVWPESLGYQNEGRQTYTGGAGVADKHNGQSIYHGSGWAYYTDLNDMHSLSFTICPDEGFVVVKLNGKYMVASIKSDADPAAIMDFYKSYISVH